MALARRTLDHQDQFEGSAFCVCIRSILVETFVERPWAGTCYRAANWRCLGETAGRGRQDRRHARAVPIKTVWVYPLGRDWLARLVAAPEVVADGQLDA